MLFGIIDATQQTSTLEDWPDLRQAQRRAGITNVDHGGIAPGVGITVYQFGLFVSPAKQRYFAIARQLFAGNAVLYGFDERGESVDLLMLPQVYFLPGAAAVERSIALGLIQRPQMSVNGEVTWEWPSDPPKGMHR